MGGLIIKGGICSLRRNSLSSHRKRVAIEPSSSAVRSSPCDTMRAESRYWPARYVTVPGATATPKHIRFCHRVSFPTYGHDPSGFRVKPSPDNTMRRLSLLRVTDSESRSTFLRLLCDQRRAMWRPHCRGTGLRICTVLASQT